MIGTIHQRLEQHYGELHWWPADSPFEVLVGTILTQNTAWTNVESAIDNLRDADALCPANLGRMPQSRLEALLRPAGYFRQKAERLQRITRYLLDTWQGQIEAWCAGPLEDARQRLLAHKGIGPETADSILLYAANRPSFVVDAYTRRIFSRIGLLTGNETYDAIRRLFMKQLPHDPELFNAYHAELVQLAKDFCRKTKPLCEDCPLLACCVFGREHTKQSEPRETGFA